MRGCQPADAGADHDQIVVFETAACDMSNGEPSRRRCAASKEPK